MNTILIADDSIDLLEMIKTVYSRRNIFIATATTREEIFSTLKRIKPDLILLDVFLENDDGRIICKELKLMNEYKTIPIILMSGSPERLIDYQEVFDDDILEKPFRIETVLSKIKAVTENRRPIS
jgi:DNA-binding response OmpR family regulator